MGSDAMGAFIAAEQKTLEQVASKAGIKPAE